MLDIDIEATGYEGYGGIRDEELWLYVRSERPSPCVACDRLTRDKDICSEVCVELDRWQAQEPGVVVEREVKGFGLESGAGHLCKYCTGVELMCEDGVMFCPRCLKVYMRFEFSSKGIEELLTSGWSVACVKSLVPTKEVGKVEVVAERLFGKVKKVRGASKEFKSQVVAYAKECGVVKAGKKFGYHRETVGRWMREAGEGTAQRYERLRKMAWRLFERGVNGKDAGKRLGVEAGTAQKWRRAWLDEKATTFGEDRVA